MSELIKHFGIDWRLLLAQAVNFLILLWVLKRYAYGPILEILRKRRIEIEKGLEFTQTAGEKLRHIEKEREEKLREAQKEALAIVNNADVIAKKRKEEIIQQANQKVEIAIADAKRLIEDEKARLREEVYEKGEKLVRLGIERVLGKLPPQARDGELIKEALLEFKRSASEVQSH